MKPHVTFVNPPYPKGAHKHPPFTPLGLGYLAAVLEKNQCEGRQTELILNIQESDKDNHV